MRFFLDLGCHCILLCIEMIQVLFGLIYDYVGNTNRTLWLDSCVEVNYDSMHYCHDLFDVLTKLNFDDFLSFT